MFRRREARQDERETFGHGGAATHYQMRQKMLAISDDYWIVDETGRRDFKVDGKALRLRQTLVFEDPGGAELAKVQERMLRVKDSMEIEGPDCTRMATVKKARIAPLRERWTVKVADDPDLEVHGNILDHEYTIGEGSHKVAEVSKRWFRLRDTYGVAVEPGQNDVLMLAVAAVIDEMADAEQ
jgi:uncharacterized protein YxjI